MKAIKLFTVICISTILVACSTEPKIKYVPVTTTCPTFPINNYPVLNQELSITVESKNDKVIMNKEDFLKLVKVYKEYKKYYNNLLLNVTEYNKKINQLNLEKLNVGKPIKSDM